MLVHGSSYDLLNMSSYNVLLEACAGNIITSDTVEADTCRCPAFCQDSCSLQLTPSPIRLRPSDKESRMMMVMMMIDHFVKILCSQSHRMEKESCYFVQQRYRYKRYRYISVRAESELATCRTSEWSLWSPVAGVSRVCLCAVVAAPEGSSALPRMAYRSCKTSRTETVSVQKI